MTKPLYIAETDENGRILCVWAVSKSGKSARVFDPLRHDLTELHAAEVSGATPRAIAAWLADQETRTSASF